MKDLQKLLEYLYISSKDNKFIIILKNNLLLEIENINFKNNIIYINLYNNINLKLEIKKISNILNIDLNKIEKYYITDEEEMKLGLKGIWLEIQENNI